MGFLDRLFGRRPPEKLPTTIQPPAPTLEIPKVEQTKPLEFVSHRLASEVKLPPRKTPESREAPRTIELQQLQWGKVTQTPHGPIRPGSEHMAAGRSENFPQIQRLSPTEIFDIDDRFRWDQYPWFKEDGGIAKRIIEVGGVHYVVCARSNGHPEGGQEKPQSRKFTQMHTITLPAEEWSIALVPQLADLLDTTPPTAQDYNLKKIECNTELLDAPLPEGWFDASVKEWIVGVLSGRPANVQDWRISVKDVLNKMYYALLCLPEAIAREISFGAGLPTTQKGTYRMGHTVQAFGDVRKIAGNWKYENGASPKLGEEYLFELEQRLTACTTPRQVLQAVETMPVPLIKRVENVLFGNEA